VREQGAAVSELPFGFRPPRSWCFLACNRIIAALADAVIVVEAGVSAGTLFTAELACRLGRDVGVVPGRTSDKSARGSNALLRDGAHVILDARDALGLVSARYTQRSSLKPTGIESSMLSASVVDLAKAQYVMRRQALQDELERLEPPTDPLLDEAEELLAGFAGFWEIEAAPAERYRLLATIFEQVWQDNGLTVAVKPRATVARYFQTASQTPKRRSGLSGVMSGSDGTRTRDLCRDRAAL
jgi:DNA recombination-mediator protein A